ncbi:MAG: PrsW family intramembrane metalloprotease [Methanosarcina flavescens]|uniref:Protease PrsW n=2 Tax=Methanosarcina flavescens TaxID=1715806 RepID=A0A660HWQ3_9EURY|nr:protease PrsW [Methanosarcina flavescens]NLK33813.1 PrsW family intramembrane metalloprotease [Methanosarcina flavescens]
MLEENSGILDRGEITDNPTKDQSPKPVTRRNSWLNVLTSATVFYILLLVALLLTGNPNLFPSLVMVGSFTVPVAYVAFLYERRQFSRLKMPTVSLAFLYGGLVAIIATSFLGPLFIIRYNPGETLAVGLVEEFAKILGVVMIARHKRHDQEMDGLILGAAVGMGFAALESTGYAFTSFLMSSGSISATVEVTLFRGLLSPLGHGTWTAILASVLFRESKDCCFRVNLQVIGAYLFVSVLHAMWNGLSLVLTPVMGLGLGAITTWVVVGFIGLYVLGARWREAIRSQITALPTETEAR